MNRQSIILLALLSIFSFSQCKHRPLQADIDYAIGLTNGRSNNKILKPPTSLEAVN